MIEYRLSNLRLEKLVDLKAEKEKQSAQELEKSLRKARQYAKELPLKELLVIEDIIKSYSTKPTIPQVCMSRYSRSYPARSINHKLTLPRICLIARLR